MNKNIAVKVLSIFIDYSLRDLIKEFFKKWKEVSAFVRCVFIKLLLKNFFKRFSSLSNKIYKRILVKKLCMFFP